MAFDLPRSLASGDALGGTLFFDPPAQNGVRPRDCPGNKCTHPPGRTRPGGVQALGRSVSRAERGHHTGIREHPEGGHAAAPDLTLSMHTRTASVEDGWAGIRMLVAGCHLSSTFVEALRNTYCF